MISEQALRLAVERAVLTPAQAESLLAIEQERARRDFDVIVDRERLRFVSGFADIFVVIGLALFFGAAGYILSDRLGPSMMWAVLALVAWGLAELFSRHRRMALPSIILLILFSGFCFLGLDALLVGLTGAPQASALGSIDYRHSALVGFAALLTCPLVGLHYWRFRVPITIAAAVGSLILAICAFFIAFFPKLALDHLGWIILVFGLAVFALAMRYDQRDPRRETRQTDIAFWLHLLAAPMMVHSFIFVAFGGITEVTPTKAGGLIAVFIGLAVIALLIDRRAILVSSLLYTGAAFSTVFKTTALSNATIPASLLVLGIFILGLSAGWRPLRNTLLGLLPAALRGRLPPASSPSPLSNLGQG